MPVAVIVDVAVVDEDCALGVVLLRADRGEEGVCGFGVGQGGFVVLGEDRESAMWFIVKSTSEPGGLRQVEKECS